MSVSPSPRVPLSYRHVSAAAQNIAAAQFALHGYDVLEQGRSTRYSYDLGVAAPVGMMKILVHCSLDGLWDSIHTYLVKTKSPHDDHHRAIDLWLERYHRTICCLVYLDESNPLGMPRIYIASAVDVAKMLHENAETLAARAGGEHSGSRSWEDTLPEAWRLNRERIAELMSMPRNN